MMMFELSILDFIQTNLRSGPGDVLMPLVTNLGKGGAIWMISAGVMLFLPKYRRAGIAILAALALDVVCCNLVLKPLIARIRPCDINTAIHLLVSQPTDFSFPSGHTAASFAATSALFFSRKKTWIPAGILAVLIAFSRLYLYLHYPTDVLAGVMLGIMMGYLGVKAVTILESYWNRRKGGRHADTIS